MNGRTPKHCSAEKPCGKCTTTCVEKLSVSYDKNIAVEDINFQFSCGELTAIIGPNGAGKSTILKAMLGQVKYSGKVRYRRSTATDEYMPRIGYVPQKLSIQPDSPISVADFLLISAGFLPVWLYIPKKKREAISEILSLVSAEKLIDRKIGGLSGGELQRVLLAASLNPMPDILLLDEPVSAVDSKGVDLFYEIICDLRRTFHLSILAVTHDIGSIAAHADKMILINRKIFIQGTPEYVLNHPDFASEMGPGYAGFKKEDTGDIHKRIRNGYLV